MKRQLTAFIIVIILVLFPLVPSGIAYADIGDTSWPEGPSVFADSAIVMEASTGLILYEKNIDKVHYPASITKILTALVVLENSSLGDIVTFSKDAVFKVDLDSSRIGIDVGEKLTIQQCLYGMLLESANEVSYALAEHVGGTVENFATMMNEKAKSLGCKDSNFVNPHGLPNKEHVTSAYDMALITRAAMKNDTFAKIFGTRNYQIPPTNIQSETRYLRNHHRFITKESYSFDGCLGGKTGYTSEAKYTLVTVAKRGDLELICVIMKDDTFDHQYTDTQRLLNFGFDNFSIYPISDSKTSQTIHESPMFTMFNPLLSKSASPIETDEKGYLVLPNTASFNDAQKDVSFFPSTKIKEGDNIIGSISYTYDGKYVGGADIIYNNVQKTTLTNTEPVVNPPASTPDQNAAVKEKDSLRPVIIGVIIGIFILITILYFILVERPRLKRKSAYYRKRATRKMYKDDDYLDL